MLELAVVLLVAIGATTACEGEGETSEAPDTGGSAEPIGAPTSEAPLDTEAPVATEAPVETNPPSQPIVVDGAPEGEVGDHSNPVPPGQIADIGNGYRLQVLAVTGDATQALLAEDPSNTPPPEGSQFTLVEIAVGYYGVDDPQFAGFPTTIQATGSDDADLPTDCGVVPNPVELFSDLFGGGVVRGNLCFVSTPADLERLRVSPSKGAFNNVAYFQDEIVLDASASPGEAPVMPTLSGVQPGTANAEARSQPTPLTTSVDIGGGWSLTVAGPAEDITDAVMAEDQFNQAPPEGYRFVGIPMRMEYSGEGVSAVVNNNLGAVGSSNVAYGGDCGAVPDGLDTIADVPAGGAVEGQLCWVVPVGDMGSELLYTFESLNDLTFFATT